MRRFVFFLLVLLIACSHKPVQEKRLNLFVWSNYIPDRIWQNFQKDTHITITYDTYDSNEALLQKLQSGVVDYDVIVPSDYMVRILIHEKLLRPLEQGQIPNLKNIGKRFMNPHYDPGNHYSVPFLWTTTGIGYNKAKVTEPVDSWSILWNPKYSGRILMLDDMRETFSVALKWKGHSLNSTDPAILAEAKLLLMLQKPLLKAYNSTNFEELLVSGDVLLAHGWSGQFAQVMDKNPDLAYAIPKEGGPLAVENFAIPASAHHIEEAYAFINYILDAHVGAEITNSCFYPNTNEAAKAFIQPKFLNDPVIYPPESLTANCELMDDIGPVNQVLDRYWTEIKSAE
ncbi:MAG: polyamine ABC transporter substrate-binding protein [Acidobacteria bacterium]|nr:MAG: polyamine ABC transporter substrate-binding protein [Acidobacteriota bacterium]